MHQHAHGARLSSPNLNKCAVILTRSHMQLRKRTNLNGMSRKFITGQIEKKKENKIKYIFIDKWLTTKDSIN